MRYLSANQFEVYEEIGKGGFGVVYRGLDKVTKSPVAIKQIDLESTDDIDSLQKEIRILSECKLKQITQYHGCFVKGYKLWIIMELLNGGSCLDMLLAGPIKEKYIAILLREVLLGLEYLHSNGKIHRDIKAANILLNTDGDVKIADFGVSTQLSNNLSRRNTFVGSPYWMSPEVILEEEYNFKTDIWSLGITAIELATGKPPLSNIHPMKAVFKIPTNEPPSLKGDEFSSEFKQFVELCLQKSPQNRLGAKKLLKTKFIQNARKNNVIGELIKRRQVWDVQNGKYEPNGQKKMKYYVPTIDSSINNGNDNNEEGFHFDFDTVDQKPTMNCNPVSNVIITKQSPLGVQGNSMLKKNLALKRNNNLLNIDSPCSKSSSNASTIKYIKDGERKPGVELAQAFRSTIQRFDTKSEISESQKSKLNQISTLLQEISEDNDELLLKVYKKFQQRVTKSESLQRSLSTISTSTVSAQPSPGPRKSDSEKLLLKRWADQYFA